MRPGTVREAWRVSGTVMAEEDWIRYQLSDLHLRREKVRRALRERLDEEIRAYEEALREATKEEKGR